MNILGIGPLEIIVLLVIGLLIFGPDDLMKAGKTAGKFIRKVTTSEGWQSLKEITREIRAIPNRLAREAELEELQEELSKETRNILPPKEELGIEEEIIVDAWATNPPKDNSKQSENKNQKTENKAD
jgi:Sec-independent protein translocase protein TatA